MKKRIFVCCVVALALSGAVRGAPGKRTKDAKKGGAMTTMTFTITSPSFGNGEYIPKKHACGGEDVSPALSWDGLPGAAKSVAVIMDDPDAPAGAWVHWIIFDLPASAKGVKENAPRTEALPDGSKQGLVWGTDDASCSRIGYFGPCPPPGKPHHYVFRVYALDKFLGLPAGTAKGALLKAMKGHILAQGELTGLYKR